MDDRLGIRFLARPNAGPRLILEVLAGQPMTLDQLAGELSLALDQINANLRPLLALGLVFEDQAHQLALDHRTVGELRDFLGSLGSGELGCSGPSDEAASVAISGSRPATSHCHTNVRLSPQEAFESFTTGMGSWWPLGRVHAGVSQAVTLIVEEGAGGRWFERGEDGVETDWGMVLLWEPPVRLVLRWQLRPGSTLMSWAGGEVRVEFEAYSGGCQVGVEHRASVGPTATPDQDQNWPWLLGRFASAAGG